MVAVILSLLHLLRWSAAADSLGTPAPAVADTAAAVGAADSIAAPAHPDTASGRARVVRQFPAVEVRAPLFDLRSSQTAREIAGPALRVYPVDGFADVVALQPGTIVQDGELHVRGGRAGETQTGLDGVSLSEPLR